MDLFIGFPYLLMSLPFVPLPSPFSRPQTLLYLRGTYVGELFRHCRIRYERAAAGTWCWRWSARNLGIEDPLPLTSYLPQILPQPIKDLRWAFLCPTVTTLASPRLEQTSSTYNESSHSTSAESGLRTQHQKESFCSKLCSQGFLIIKILHLFVQRWRL